MAEDEEYSGGDFDGGIAPCDGLAASAAAGAEEYPAEDGDEFERGDGAFAMRAAGARADDGLMKRQARDEHVEEAAEDESDDEDKNGEKNLHRGKYRVLCELVWVRVLDVD